MALRYGNAKDLDQRKDAAIDLTQWARDILNAGGDTVVRVTRPHCSDLHCGGIGATILLMRPDRPTRMIEITKSLETVTKADLRAALLPVIRDEPQQRWQRDS
jgi:hypothetical protein